MVNISWFQHYHYNISTNEPIQLRLKLLKTQNNQIDGFAKKSLTATIGILEETNIYSLSN